MNNLFTANSASDRWGIILM